jgi:hypothetical protein
MIATCVKCGLRATVVVTGIDAYSTRLPDSFVVRCPVLSEKLREKGELKGEDTVNCPQMMEATGTVFFQWQQSR